MDDSDDGGEEAARGASAARPDDCSARDSDGGVGGEPDLDALAAVARRAARAGGEYLRDRFRSGPVEAEYGTDDVKAAADVAAEERVLAELREAYPGHAFHGEESGRNGDAEIEWVVDPLDGTNNFAAGLPAFATAVAAVRDGEPLVAAIHEPLPGTTYVARTGAGARANGEPLRADSDLPLDRGTVSFVWGLPAVRDADLAADADAMAGALRDRCKRVVETWSPCVDWGLVAGGSLEGIVCYHPDVYEQYAGSLLAAEAGVAAVERDGLYVGASDAATRDELLEAVESALR